jgi:hypothetical protein
MINKAGEKLKNPQITITINETTYYFYRDSKKLNDIYISKRDAKHEGIVDPIKMLEHEVEQYDHYLVGNCYGFTIEDQEGEMLDSVGGFIGYEDFAIEEAKTNADYWERTLPKQYPLALA